MKTLAILSLVAVAFASQSWTTYKAEKLYTYRFEGQLATGLPIPSSQHFISRVESLVDLVFENEFTARVQLKDPRFFSVNREVSEIRDLLPKELFDKIELTEEQRRELSLPLRFRYERGLISEIEFEREDKPWSENIKRAILNMMQLNIRKQHRTDKKELETLRLEGEMREWNEEDSFIAREKTLEGDCETTYTFVPSADKKRMTVSKSINFDKCERRVDIRYNYRFGEDLLQKETERKEEMTESSTVFRYDINMERESFLIREVEVRSHYLVVPFDKEQQHMATFVHNKLTLVEETSEVERVRMLKEKSEKTHSIVYSTEQEEKLELFRMTGDEKYLRRVSFPWMNKKVEIGRKIVEEIRDLVSVSKREEIKEQITHELARLVEVLRVCTKEEIHKIGHELEKTEELRSLWFDQLAITGTKSSLEMLFEKIVEKKVNPVHAHKLIKSVAFIRNPHQKIVDMLFELSERVEKNEPLRQSISLTIGSVLNGLCGEHKDRLALNIREEKPVCSRELKEKYVRELKKRFEDSRTRYEKVLALKTMANSGMDLIVFPLEKIIKDEREDKTVRMQAIEALRKLRNVMPRKIQSILLPVYKNIREYPEVRVSAFHQIMHTLPERAIIDQLVQQLEREPSRQVYSFVYTTLKALSESELPREKEMARDIELSLKLHRVQGRKMLDSTLLRESLFSEEYKAGSAFTSAFVFSNDSILPKDMMASLDTIFAGEWTKHFAQIGIFQNNMDKIVYKLVEKVEKNMPTLRANRGQMKPTEVMREMMKKMGIEKRRRSIDSDSHATIYLRYKDMDFIVLPFDEKLVDEVYEKVFSEGKIRLDEVRRILEKGINFETKLATFVYERTRMLPTTLGLPVEISTKMPTFFNIRGELKAEIVRGKVAVTLKALPEIISTHVSHMEVRSPVISHGIRLLHTAKLALPIDTTLEVEWERKVDARLIVRTPEEKQRRVLNIHTRPVTYIRYENRDRKYERSEEKTIVFQEQPRMEINKVYGEKILGLRFNIKGDLHRHLFEKMNTNKNLPIYITENVMEVVMEKTEKSPKEYVVKMSVHPVDFEEQMSAMPELEGFYEKEEDYFTVEDSDYLPENEKERRTSFGKYVKEYKKGSALSHRFNVEIHTVGGEEKRKATFDIRTLCDSRLSYCKWELEAMRTPIEEENKEWTLKANMQVLFPERVETLKQLHEQKHRELHGQMDARWGSEEKNTLKIRIQAEQSKDQQKWQRLTTEKDQKRTTLESLERLELAARLNQVKFYVDYNIEPKTLVQFSRVSALLKWWKPLSTSVEPRQSLKTLERNGRLTAMITVEPQTWRYINLSLESPSERVEIKDIRLPFRPTFLTIEKLDLDFDWTEAPKCEVGSSRISTFDEVIFRAPLTTCYSVLAKDCSETPRFVVLMKKMEKKGEEKKLRIVTEEKEIEIEPRKDEYIVKVDGKTLKESEYERHDILVRDEVVIFKNKDIRVRFDGVKAEIKMSQRFKNQQCGLCGHFDGEREGEFRRADFEYTDNIEEFHRSYLLNENCEMEEDRLTKKENYKKYERFEDSTSYEDSKEEYDWKKDSREEKFDKYDEEYDRETVEPIKKVRVIEYSNRVCFSHERVPECPRNTHEEEKTIKDIKMKFSCKDRSDYETRRMLRDLRNEDLTEEITRLPVSFVEEIRVPKTCVVY